MAQRHYLQLADGSTIEVTSRVPLEGWELTEKAEEGAVGSGTMWLADPAMDLDIDGLRTYYIVEDSSEATDNVLFGGFVADPELSRGEQGDMHYDPVARNWQIQLTDRNGYWNRRVMVGTDCKRPAESDVARIQWLFASSEAAWVEDDTTYVGTASPSNMDKVDYRGQGLQQVVDDCAQHTGKNWWVQLQETGTGRKDVAWYGKDSRTVYSSDLYLSNDPADWADADLADGTSYVWPLGDQTKLKRDLSRVYTGVYLRYANGARAIYRTNATSVTVYGRRDHVADYPNVKTKAKAEARATRLLADLGDPDERITTTVELPAARATMIRAGMRVRVKATHLEGYDDQFYWMRVLACTVSPVAAGTRYRLNLELQASGAVAAGSGVPYAGDAFAGLLRIQEVGAEPYNVEFLKTGDSPPVGWYAEPTVGAMWTFTGSDGAYTGITTSVAMRARIECKLWFNTVAETASATLTVSTTSAGVVGTTTVTKTGGLASWQEYVTVDVEVDLAAGDTVTWDTTETGFLIGGWLPDGLVNNNVLRVGRGTHVWDTGNVTWVGA